MNLVKPHFLTAGRLPAHLDRLLRIRPTGDFLPVPPTQYHAMIVVEYRHGQITRDECWRRLYNAGFRGQALRF